MRINRIIIVHNISSISKPRDAVPIGIDVNGMDVRWCRGSCCRIIAAMSVGWISDAIGVRGLNLHFISDVAVGDLSSLLLPLEARDISRAPDILGSACGVDEDGGSVERIGAMVWGSLLSGNSVECGILV